MSNNYMKKSLIYGVRKHSINWNIGSVESARVRGNRSVKEGEHSKAMHTWIRNAGRQSPSGTRDKT